MLPTPVVAKVQFLANNKKVSTKEYVGQRECSRQELAN